MMIYRLLLLLTLCLVGCDDRKTFNALQAENQAALKNPELVGVTEQGREVKRYIINNPDYADGASVHEHPHWVYIVGDTISVNYMETHGKQRNNQVIVIVQGHTNIIELEQPK